MRDVVGFGQEWYGFGLIENLGQVFGFNLDNS